jgi:hypothetical protein
MFGFEKVHGFKRKEWNTEVDRVLQDCIGIDTKNKKQNLFPGILAYANILDEGWQQKHHPHWYAILTALNFWGGCMLKGGDDERVIALGFKPQLISFTHDAVARGIVSKSNLEKILIKMQGTLEELGL